MSSFLKKTVVCTTSVIISLSAWALKYGDIAPDLQIAKWIKNGPVNMTTEPNSKKIYVVFFFATWQIGIDNLVRFVDDQVDTFRDAGVVMIGISKENEGHLLEFVKKYPEINFSLAMDNKLKTYNDYMKGAEGLPVFFIFDANKKLLWKGSPIEEGNVLLKVIGGNFNPDDQIKIEKIRNDLAEAAQNFDFETEEKYAKEILQLDPTDKAATDIIINKYIKDNKIDECLNFVRETRKKAGNNRYIQFSFYMTELDIVRGILDRNGRDNIKKLISDYQVSFKDDPMALNTCAMRIMQLVPLEFLPLEELFEMAKDINALDAKLYNSANAGNFQQTLARVYYYIGDLDQAFSCQKKAIAALKDVKAISAASLSLDYYQEALRIHNSTYTK